MFHAGRILCPVDFSEFSARAVHHAVLLAKSYGAPLTMLHVVATSPTVDVPPIELTAADREHLVQTMKALVGEAPSSVPIDFRVCEARDVRQEILEQIDILKANLVVIGTHGRTGFEKLLLGSVAEKVLRKASCPVMVVPRSAPDAVGPVHFTRIVCPVDFSGCSEKALTYALSIAQETDAQLTIMHVIEMPPELREHFATVPDLDIDRLHASARAAATQRVRDLVSRSARGSRAVDVVVREGAAYRQILAVAAEQRSDVIVMGVEGRGAVDLAVFGSNTSHVIRAATCPVLAVPCPETRAS
jgi:nucleotide-binding universal stress UspA family protein